MKIRRTDSAARARKLTVAWGKKSHFAVPIPRDEKQRLADLRRYDILDTAPEVEFDSLTRLAAHICDAPIAVISLVDSNRQWFKSKVGMRLTGTAREISFCAHAIAQRGLFVVKDTLADPRFAHSPLVISGPKVRFYAGAPLLTPDAHAIGTLCVMDRKPRELTGAQADALEMLGRQVMFQLEQRRRLRLLQDRLADSRSEIKELRNRIHRIASTRCR